MELIDLLHHFKIKVHNKQYFINAFTHSSFAHEKKELTKDYERMEFMGDAVLDLVIADLIFSRYPQMPQGQMTKLRSALVCSTSLAKYANLYNFSELIRLGQGQQKDGGANQKILEDVFEAFIGATYLDQGFEFTKNMIKEIFLNDIVHFNLEELTDYKSKLQEYLQSNNRGNIRYEVVEERNSSQNKEFVIEVSMIMEDKSVLKLGRGIGKNKKAAEEEAAKDALSKQARF